ncbi:MAG: hypothetical protein E7L00_04640 [Propionibacteriaceae bacterium]|nr:hypothetical protein [Propionibacteriaceae bacterium]
MENSRNRRWSSAPDSGLTQWGSSPIAGEAGFQLAYAARDFIANEPHALGSLDAAAQHHDAIGAGEEPGIDRLAVLTLDRGADLVQAA